MVCMGRGYWEERGDVTSRGKEKEWMGPQKSLLVRLIQLVLYLRPQLAGVGDSLGMMCAKRGKDA
uniref:Putative ovule protein n=1 Tax=Solanum chacoense TaxID=4108 RepID=A0A0V0GIG6_SOLCH